MEFDCTGNQIWFYDIVDVPGFSALPGFKAPFYGDGQRSLNPGTTVFLQGAEIFAVAKNTVEIISNVNNIAAFICLKQKIS